MKVVAMRLKMDIIHFVKFYHPTNGSSLTSVSTYLQKNSSGFPLHKPRCVRLRDAHMGPNTPFSSQREAVVSQDFMGTIPLPWQPVGLDIS